MTIKTQQLDFERMRILYSSMNRIFIGGALLIFFIGFLIRDHMETRLVIFWVALTLLLYMPRLFVTRQFNKKINDKNILPSNVLKWETYWILTTVPALASFSSLLYYPLDTSQLHVVPIYLILLASGSILSYASSMKSIVAAFCIIYIPLIIHYFSSDDKDAIVLGVFYISVVIMFITYALSLNRTLIENIKLKLDHENHSLQDPLTRLWNRRGLYLHLNKILPRAIRNNETFGIILFDVDFFKQYNDTHGHNAGDDVLINVAICIEKEGRDEDLIIRYGGEEFLAVIPDTTIEDLISITERIFESIRSNTNVTVSAGLALHSADINFNQLIKLADDVLYEAKNAGRDQYKVASK